ncbi:MAG: glycine cleavage system protein GcvH [Candidatus Krumholzibacteria bacterium]|nr:glycine cleavage system protein GcvH [Candidatus Krumholzibacteria bacterium]MDP6668722.1 glycine cleavage system protein GcvH [Candidatus Krumholzibacteria bacterium]MDP6797225.1 glycine cleavage system protein GcvH [Candidatus Krumholzibacteria bacterium]MDP7021184.1 glycine cleavage system protein GcvH [Candidatus Krumholzibacteria bacterium]
MSQIPEDLRYTKEHEWVRLEGDVATLGVTDYAQGELGDIIYVELPAAGSTLSPGDAFGTVEAVKTVEELNCPFEAEVLEVNDSLESSPETVNQDAYGEGWMVRVRLKDPAQCEDMLDAAAYRGLIGE